MRGRIQLPQPMAETGLGKEEKRKFNMLLRAVQMLVPVNSGSEVIELTSMGTSRRNLGTSSRSGTDTEGRWL